MKPSPQRTTIQLAIRNAQRLLSAHCDSARLDSLVLLSYVTGRSKEWLLAHNDEPLSQLYVTQFQDCIEQRLRGTPIAYITGEKEFWSLPFYVNKSVLIPRPETELIVEVALQQSSSSIQSILDLGTGCGCIAISLAKTFPHASVTATDSNVDALEIARKNKLRHSINNLTLLQGDWFENLLNQRFDLIVSNPPYIAFNDPQAEAAVREYEPHSALFAEDNGMNCIRAITSQALHHLNSQGRLIIEHGWKQADEVCRLFEQRGFTQIESAVDLQGHERVTTGIIQ